MSSISPASEHNRLVDRLPVKQRKALLGGCTIQNLSFGDILGGENTVVKYAYFPLTAFISLMSRVDNHRPLEMGMIGNEGMLGATLALGVGINPARAIVQGAGTTLRIPAQRFRTELKNSPALQKTCQLYLYVLMEQLAKAAACNHFHQVEARLARWLLMSHDRAHGQKINLTHEFLSGMLGVQRSAVTIAAHGLQSKDIITYSRGKIAVLSRPRLALMACGCYEESLHCYNRQLTS